MHSYRHASTTTMLYWRLTSCNECSCGQRHTQVRPPIVATLTHRTTLAQCTGAGRVQARPHGVRLSAQPSTPVPRRPLPACLQCRLQTTSSLCHPRYSRHASPSSQKLLSAGFFSMAGSAIWNWLPDSLRDPAVSRLLHTFTENVFYFQLTYHFVRSAWELFGRCALQIYLLTYYAVRGHPRSASSIPIESSYATSY